MNHFDWFIFICVSIGLLFIPSPGHAAPDFMIIGVTKCGTSFLYANIVQHPQILGATKKELHYFDEKYHLGSEWYSLQFPEKSQPDELVGEGSPGYFWKRGCLEKIAQDCPDTKFILILRNPVKRAISSYFYFKEIEPQRAGADFISTIYKKSDRDYLFTNYERHIGAGLYSYHLQKWLKYFPREQFHILFLEDLIEDYQGEFNKIFAFLGVSEQAITIVDRKGKNNYNLAEIDPEVIEWLQGIYRPYNQKLEELLGRPHPWSERK